MQVEWAESAYKSLKDVIEYTEEEFGNRQVEVIAKKIADTVRTISAIPNAFPKESLLSRMKGNYHSAVVIRELKVVLPYNIQRPHPDCLYMEYQNECEESNRKTQERKNMRGTAPCHTRGNAPV